MGAVQVPLVATVGIKESVVERYLIKRVRELGGETRKVVFPGHDGAPDRLVLFPPIIRDGLALHTDLAWVELKSPLGKLRPAQIREHKRLRALGQNVKVIRSKEEVDLLVGDSRA